MTVFPQAIRLVPYLRARPPLLSARTLCSSSLTGVEKWKCARSACLAFIPLPGTGRDFPLPSSTITLN